MLLQMARMSVDDGLVMTIHPGVYRNHSSATFERLRRRHRARHPGQRRPTPTNLRPLLERHGLEPDLHLVLFSVDETVLLARDRAARGLLPERLHRRAVVVPRRPDAVLRFRAAVTETAGFYRGSGFIDDTRAFLSIPARHDMARRLDSAFLARLVREGRVVACAAERIAVDLVDAIPRKVFKL